jgi:hypothetical protein
MPIQRRLSYCFCLFTALALACETSGQVARERHDGPSPPIDTNLVKPSQPGTFNLRGNPMKGRTRHTEGIIDMEAAQLTVKAGPITVSGTMTMRVQNTDDLEIHDVRDGLIRQGRLVHVLDKTTTTTRMSVPGSDDTMETEEEFGELHGRAELIELHGGKWTRKLVGAPPSPELTAVLEDPPLDDNFYPTAIKLGESWTLTGADLRRWMESEFIVTRGEMTSTFVAVEALPEETIAVIEVSGEIGGTVPDEDFGELAFTMTLQGRERRSIERAMEIESSLSGSIEFSGSRVEDGLTVSVTMSGPVTIRAKGALR